MPLDIHANVFHPLGQGEPFLVLAWSFPTRGPCEPSRTGRSATARTLDEAWVKCQALAGALRAALVEAGDEVRDVHLSEHR